MSHTLQCGCILLSLGAVLCVLLMGCSGEKKIEPVKPARWNRTDPGTDTLSSIPGWIANTQVGRAAFYTCRRSTRNSSDPPPYPDGVSIMVDVMKTRRPIRRGRDA